jgi:hypothetical protein
MWIWGKGCECRKEGLLGMWEGKGGKEEEKD